MIIYYLAIGCGVLFGLIGLIFVLAAAFGDAINDRNHRRAGLTLSKTVPVPEANESARLLERAA